ncbi:MAG: PilZ domain-containing protein [Proteobacteria bacterium]|nr:PilZ domain-containing protein [Pseudomonadota bacterium]MBU1639302.1 PilZ domain-containing protein [Pseudomonadota bacterium]
MGSSFEEKRASARTFFNNGEKIAAAINGTGGEPFFVDILNISAGGLQFSQKRQGAITVKPGDYLTLVGLNGLAELQDVEEVRMEVRWVIDHNFLNLISAGCQFHDLSSRDEEKIQRLVEARSKL